MRRTLPKTKSVTLCQQSAGDKGMNEVTGPGEGKMDEGLSCEKQYRQGFETKALMP